MPPSPAFLQADPATTMITQRDGDASPQRSPATTRTRSGKLAPLLAVLLAGCLLLAGCGKSASNDASTGTGSGAAATSTESTACPTANTKSFAKTKFVLHAGLAFGTFHRYIYKPFKAGSFQKGADGRVKAFVKAGATALFMKREIRLAIEDVKANPTLCRTLAAPLSRLSDTISGAVSKAKDGDSSGLEDANSQISDMSRQSAAGGTPITESTDESKG